MNLSFTRKRERICKRMNALIQNPQGSLDRGGTKAKTNQRENHKGVETTFHNERSPKGKGVKAVELLYLWATNSSSCALNI